MANQLTWGGFGLRWLFAIILVVATYNPEGYSYFDWVVRHAPHITPLKALTGVVLLIGWVIYLRATLRSLGPVGLVLAAGLFGTLLWLFIDLGWLTADSARAITYMAMFILSTVLAIGMSWSHIRRRLSGQLDVDDVEE